MREGVAARSLYSTSLLTETVLATLFDDYLQPGITLSINNRPTYQVKRLLAALTAFFFWRFEFCTFVEFVLSSRVDSSA